MKIRLNELVDHGGAGCSMNGIQYWQKRNRRTRITCTHYSAIRHQTWHRTLVRLGAILVCITERFLELSTLGQTRDSTETDGGKDQIIKNSNLGLSSIK